MPDSEEPGQFNTGEQPMESPSQYQNNEPNTSTDLERTWQWITLGLIAAMALGALALAWHVADVMGGAL